MARHKKHQSIEDTDPVLDISSLIDVCFLLLIYFVVTSTITPRETDLGLALPGSSSSSEQPEIEPMLITIEQSGAIYTGGGGAGQQAMDTNVSVRELPLLTASLELFMSGVKAAGAEPVVQLNAHPEATQQRVVDVLNALAGVGIKGVTFTDLLE